VAAALAVGVMLLAVTGAGALAGAHVRRGNEGALSRGGVQGVVVGAGRPLELASIVQRQASPSQIATRSSVVMDIGLGIDPLAAFAPATGAISAAAQSTISAAAVAATIDSAAGRRPDPGPTEGLLSGVVVRASARQSIDRSVRVVPVAVWVALAAALALASFGGAYALRSARRSRRQAGRFAAVSEAALTDPLTGVLNRRGFSEAVERELARARRYDHPFVLAYVDVRGLKHINDSAGHLAGDQLIREAARILTDSARAGDVVGRIGGDELGLLLPEQSTAGGLAVSARVAQEVTRRRVAVGLGTRWDLTIGTAAYPDDGRTFEELLRVADRRLYEQRGIALS
jgi:diguanylate cyclase (GGDEF)-like protein